MKFFVSIGWLYVIAIMAIVLGVNLCLKWRSWELRRKLCAMAVITLVLHVWEEWVLPGGYWYLYNLGSNNYPMSQLTDMLTNFLGVALGTVVVMYGVNNISTITIMFVCLSEALVHSTVIVAKSLSAFSDAGITVIYNPGMLTALLLFLPIGLSLLISLLRSHLRVSRWIYGIISFAILMNVTVIAPEALLQNMDSEYAFDNKGYYQQFDVLLPGDTD